MLNITLNEFEKIEDLGLGGLKVIQDKRGFCFGSDAVLLGRFLKIKKGARVLDLCTGTGIVAVLCYGLCQPKSVDAVEIVPSVAQMAQKTMLLNNLQDIIRVQEADLKNAPELFGHSVFDAVTCNPPYMNIGGGLINPKDNLAVARHEIKCTLDDVVRISRSVLKPGGKLFMVHRSDRTVDVIATMRKYNIEPKRIQTVYPSADKRAILILVEGALGGRPQLICEPPIFMYDENGNYLQSLK